MRLTKMTNGGDYWLKAESREDMLEIQEFCDDMLDGENNAKPMAIKVKTLGDEKADIDKRPLPIRIQIEKI